MASTIYLADSGNNTLYTFPDGFHLDRYRLSKRTKSVNKAYQHGGDIIGDEKHDLQHISLVGTLGAASIALFESACTLMKQNVVKSNLRLYGAYKTDQYFDIKALESFDIEVLISLICSVKSKITFNNILLHQSTCRLKQGYAGCT